MNAEMRVVSTFADAASLAQALARLKEAGRRDLRVYSPAGLPQLEPLLPRRSSPIRFIVLAAAITGCLLGFWMSIGSAWRYGLIVGGKHPTSILPYCVIGFECLVLIGGLTALGAVLWYARLRPGRVSVGYDPRFGEDRFGIVVECARGDAPSVVADLRAAGAEEVREQPIGK